VGKSELQSNPQAHLCKLVVDFDGAAYLEHKVSEFHLSERSGSKNIFYRNICRSTSSLDALSSYFVHRSESDKNYGAPLRMMRDIHLIIASKLCYARGSRFLGISSAIK
jgi:hypothetical protein